MDLVLVTITGISLVLAIVMGVIVFRLVREERQRSEARVQLLKDAIGESPSWDLFEFESEADAPRDLHGVQSHPVPLFSVPDLESVWLRRAGVAVMVALIVAAAGYIMMRAGTAEPARPIAAAMTPLELVALQHAAENDALTISGTLLNPREGTAVTELAVTASVFGPDGAVLASGRAPLDYRTLAPGEESGFLVKIPVHGTVSRYRVGFRRLDGSVVAHVDRRIDVPAAGHGGSTENASWAR